MKDLGTIELEKEYKERISGYVKGAVCGEYCVSLILGIGLISRGIVRSLLLLAGLGMLLGSEYTAVGGIASQLFLEKRSGVFARPSAVIEGRASSKKLLHRTPGSTNIHFCCCLLQC